ncbi:hypothetical protein [Pacificispira sp.]|uniref:hypothetical protein n=1 Tax=Pacificispira sp. TaxID=2888761 RepID=UPI003B524BBA
MTKDKPDNKLPLRPSLAVHAYLEELADWGTFGKTKNAVAMRFIEDGIKAAIDRGDIQRLSARNFPDWKGEDE